MKQAKILKQKNNEKKFKRTWATLLILVLLIVFGLSYASFGKIDVLVPTGNIDIFDINIIKEKCETCKICPTCNCETKPVIGSDTEPSEEDDGVLSVFDETDLLENQETINIFKNPAFEYSSSTIAPGVTNTYQFVVRNNNEFGIVYDISMLEENADNINMKYKLKRNGYYIVGSETEWVSANEVYFSDKVLANKSKDVYSLEWKWIESHNDTFIGETATELYKLKITFEAEEYQA